MGIKFYKLKEENVPSKTNEDCVIFTNEGNIYISTFDGSLIKMLGGSSGSSGSTGDDSTSDTPNPNITYVTASEIYNNALAGTNGYSVSANTDLTLYAINNKQFDVPNGSSSLKLSTSYNGYTMLRLSGTSTTEKKIMCRFECTEPTIVRFKLGINGGSSSCATKVYTNGSVIGTVYSAGSAYTSASNYVEKTIERTYVAGSHQFSIMYSPSSNYKYDTVGAFIAGIEFEKVS